MKDPIQLSGNEVSVVIYDAPLPPRYLKFSKRFLRTLFIVTPSLIGVIIVALVLYGLAPSVKEMPRPTLPNVMSGDDSRISQLEAELKSLQTSNELLQNKIAAPAGGDTAQEDQFLACIKKPYGMQNLVGQGKVTIDQVEYVPAADRVNLKFQIISANPENRVAGHVLVMMISKTGLMAYPPEANESMDTGIKFSMGEPFAVSRLRPTNAEFLFRPTGESVKFLIYIFSREGDLLLIKENGPYNVSGK